MFPSPTDGLAGAPSAREGDPEFALRVIERLSVPTFALAADRRVLLWNKACEELTGVPAQEVLGTLSQWRAFYDKPRPCLAELVLARRFEDVALFYARGGRTAPGDDRVSAEDWCAMPKLDRPLYLAIEAAPIYDETGAMIAAVESLRDITAERRRQAELESLAALDGLTGLLNRRSFDERLAQEARRASRVNHPLALLMIDVDDFKPFNDAYGHQIGDACLRSAAQAIRGALSRAGDVAARYGGDEFAVILPGADKTGALRVAKRIRERVDALPLANPFSTTSQKLTLSIGGCAAARDFDGSAERLVALSDSELYRVKRAGRDRTSIAEFEADSTALGEQSATPLDPPLAPAVSIS
jgi:diguanylate cyclase (GGDEF)-like protein